MERESFKLVQPFFLKLLFLCVFLYPISLVQQGLPAWRQTRATRRVGNWAWPDCSMAAMSLGAIGAGRHKLLLALGASCSRTRGVGWIGSSASVSGAGRHPEQDVRKKVAKQSQPGMHHASTWLSAFVGPRANKLAHDCW